MGTFSPSVGTGTALWDGGLLRPRLEPVMPAWQTPDPFDVGVRLPTDCSPSINAALRAATGIVERASLTKHGLQIAAALVLDDGQRVVSATNSKADDLCAEASALLIAQAEGFSSIDSIVTVVRRPGESSKLGGSCMCGSCRQIFRSVTRPDTPVIISPPDSSSLLVSTMRGILPFSYLDENGEPSRAELGERLEGRIVSLSELEPCKYRLIERAFESMLEYRSTDSQLVRGVALQDAAGEIICSYQSVEAQRRDGVSAESRILASAGTAELLTLAVVAGNFAVPGLIFSAPDGLSRQLILNAVRATGRDFNLLLLLPDGRSVLEVSAGMLLPMARATALKNLSD